MATDPLRFALWQPDVVSVQLLEGSLIATTRRMTGGARTIVQQITRNDPPHVWSARCVDGPVRPHATITVEPIDAGAGSRVTFTLDFEGHERGYGVPAPQRTGAMMHDSISHARNHRPHPEEPAKRASRRMAAG